MSELNGKEFQIKVLGLSCDSVIRLIRVGFSELNLLSWLSTNFYFFKSVSILKVLIRFQSDVILLILENMSLVELSMK